MPNQIVLDWTDEDGVDADSRWWTLQTAPGAIQDLINALRDVSAASLARFGVLLTGAPSPAIPSVAGAYDAADKVVFEFRGSDSLIYKVTVPAPKATIFSDSDNVNLANAAVVAFRDACFDALRTRGDESLTELVRGYRARTSRQAS